MNDNLITSTIVESLIRNGALDVKRLFKNVKKLHGNIDNRYFEKTLMTMELQGLIRVYGMTKDKRRVELARS